MIPKFESELQEADLDILRAGMRAHAEKHVPWDTYQEGHVLNPE